MQGFDFLNSLKEEGCNFPLNLTKRELEVLRLVVQGKSNTQIAEELNVSPHTAKSHVCAILFKMGVKDRVQAAVKAVVSGYCKFC